jgi:hypothetical protein
MVHAQTQLVINHAIQKGMAKYSKNIQKYTPYTGSCIAAKNVMNSFNVFFMFLFTSYIFHQKEAIKKGEPEKNHS